MRQEDKMACENPVGPVDIAFSRVVDADRIKETHELHSM